MTGRYLPFLQWIGNYNSRQFKGDLSAGITVGVLLIPQGMAYAMIAGLPPVFGLYAALLPQVVYGLLGTSRQLSVGPVALDSLLVATGLGALSLSGLDEYISMAIFLALFMGGIQFLLGIFRMGFLVNFLSRPVISGFTTAAAIIIGASQLKHLLGIQIANSNKVMEVLQATVSAVGETHGLSLLIGLSGILLILGIRRMAWKIPAALLVLVLGILASWVFSFESLGVRVVGEVPQGLPGFSLPSFKWEDVTTLFPMALTLALVAYMEAIAVAKAVAERHPEYRLDPNQELRAIGLSNILGSFFQAYPVTGGFSRTAVNEQAGARTGVAAFISAAIVAFTLVFLMPLVYYLPIALLAAVVMVAVAGLVDLQYPRELFRHQRDEFVLLLATFLITLLVGVVEGILLGVLISLLLLVYRISKPHIAVLGRVKGTDYFKNLNRFQKDTESDEDMLIIRFDSQLFFGNLEYFREELEKHINRKGPALRYVILNAEAINYMDSSAVHMFRDLLKELKARGIDFYITGAIGPIRDILFKTGLIELIGETHLFVRTYEAVDAIRGKVSPGLGGKIATQRTGIRD